MLIHVHLQVPVAQHKNAQFHVAYGSYLTSWHNSILFINYEQIKNN